MNEPLRIVFDVACGVDHAFAVWTERVGSWWPRDHTISGAPTAVVFEGWVGGRMYERTAQGEEHDLGTVTAWRPPVQLGYHWHLGATPDAATEVTVTFSVLDESTTRVEIEQAGWERLGVAGPDLRRRNRVGWESLVPCVRAAIEEGA